MNEICIALNDRVYEAARSSSTAQLRAEYDRRMAITRSARRWGLLIALLAGTWGGLQFCALLMSRFAEAATALDLTIVFAAGALVSAMVAFALTYLIVNVVALLRAGLPLDSYVNVLALRLRENASEIVGRVSALQEPADELSAASEPPPVA